MNRHSAAQPPTDRFLVPPLSLSFQITQRHREKCLIEAQAYSGNHCFVSRELEAHYDHFGEIPVMIGSSMLSWTLWLVQFEAERRDRSRGRRPADQARFPDWPRPERTLIDVQDVGF
jgi:hypothetical protein